ncbi:3'-5' RNA helicase YTHDC2-like isoform X2 [Saccostrea echinata]|uniref:3'-5' RNA helicase YTHDC2-like isoform X2 n=1 Tax=Saccostrea echinata TaxID=191078 RepID=UPI002A7F5377|nr:3'-5' RNA helicase YTHDC2-like isoform X2 [Saccostrea echinata]
MAARYEDPYRPTNNGAQWSYSRAMMQSPSSNGSRPQSNSSVVSERGPRTSEDVCIGEEVRISLHLAIERFRRNEDQKELEFPSSLSATERAYVHRYCDTVGLKHKSKGKGNNRILTISKKELNQTQASASSVKIIRNSRQQICNLLQRFPLTTKERQELMPQMERSQAFDTSREAAKATIGKLNNGVAQVPPPRASTELDAFRNTLPVFKHKEEIIHSISSNRIILITGETGSGKTTQIPQMILDDCTVNNKRCRILCTQPRRIAALSIAERVSAERGEKVGQTVGYQIRLESKVSPKTLLTFCTNGVLLRTLMNGSHSLSTVTHVIVDEVHERDRFSDFLLTAIRDELPKYQQMKLILMSASMNVDLFIRYFNNCPVLRFPGSLFDVEEHFLEDVLKWTGYTNKKMEKLKKSQSNLEKQQKHLSQWCQIQMEEASTTPHSEEIEEKMAAELSEEQKFSESADEKEELEPWLVKEMDDLLSEIWLTGNEDCFSQLIHLIKSENVSVDYQHSETSLSALMIAAARGFTAVVEHLLNFGANAKLKSSNDWTALDFAKKFNQEEVIEMLQAYMVEYEMGSSDEISVIATVPARILSEEDKELLNLYQHSFDDDKVDIILILQLIIKILSTSKDGAILVFLSGYDDIVTLRETLSDSKNMDKFRYVLYTLHSSMQSNDQKRVFKSVPHGVRKIILATNIAETSITINDVVYVIDSGKVKEKAFDALLSLSMLKSTWISKASALQRKGRAGRCKPGVCYHLFSRIRYSMMQDFATPELLRFPLQEICLHTKLIAPIHCPIAEFLAKAPEPPPYMVTRNAVLLLKQIDALDHFEDLTEIGYHLADLPLEPRLGKVVLYSIVLKCLDPILTIVCALAYRDPFILPSSPHLKRAADQVRRQYSSNTFSDHMALLRAFQGWQRARTDNCERSYCEKNFLSSACMEMIVGMRTQLLGQLRASGFVRARGGGDIRDLNTNSENWAAVKAALCAGIYPNLVKIERCTNIKMVSQKSSGIKFHTSSVLKNPALPEKKAIQNIPTDWVLYEEMSRYERSAYIRCCTAISPITVALFTGPIKLPPESVRDGTKAHAMLHAGMEDSSDSEGEEKEDNTKTTLQFDDWLAFKLDNETANMVLQLRHKWNCLFLRRMRAPSKPWSQVDEAVIKAVISVLSNEEQALGFQQPAGIGQRPRPMTEYMSAGGGSYSSYDNEDHSNRGRRTPVTPPKKHTSVLPRTPRTPGNTRSDGSSASSSPKGSVPTTPCTSPQTGSNTLASPAKSTSKYFVVKPNDQNVLDVALSKSIYATSPKSEARFNKAIQDGKELYLIFSTVGSGQFQGYARVTEQSSKDKCPDMSGDGLGGTFKIEWIKKVVVPFKATHNITNSWNENKRVQYSKDGHELESSCGEKLIHVLQTFEPKLYEASSDEMKENDEETDLSSDKASKSSHSEEDKDSLLSDEDRTKQDDGDRNSNNTRGRYPGHYQGRHQQGYEGQRPGSYPYSSSSQNHQYYHHQQQGYHGGGGGGHYNSRMYNMGYPPPMGPNYNPMYMGMHSPPRHPLSPVMILQRGQRSGSHFRGYHPGYGSGYH